MQFIWETFHCFTSRISVDYCIFNFHQSCIWIILSIGSMSIIGRKKQCLSILTWLNEYRFSFYSFSFFLYFQWQFKSLIKYLKNFLFINRKKNATTLLTFINFNWIVQVLVSFCVCVSVCFHLLQTKSLACFGDVQFEYSCLNVTNCT